jgi:di/tricarboxylate transporter
MELPALPEAHAIAVLALVIVALYLFTRESIPLESSSLAVLVALTVGFELVPFSRDGTTLHAIDFFSGFGHEALIAVCALMIAGHGLVRTGALEPVGRALARLWSFSPALALLLTLVAGAVLSAFVNNVPIVVLLLPILVGISLHTGKSASAVLMPMGFATLVGGMSTTIGTSTNLLVVSVAADLGMRRLEMFDFFVPAAIAGAIGIVYLWLIAPRMLPVREAALADTSPRIFTAHLNVEPDGFADGRTVTEIRDKAGSHFRIRGIDRGAGVSLTPLPDTVIRVGDRIAVRDTPDRLKEYEEVLGARLYSTDKPVDDEHPLTAEDQQVAEIVITQGSPLENTTLALARFREQFRLVTLALHRAGAQVKIERTRIRDIPLRLGDVLLVQGSREHVAAVKRGGDLLVLDATSDLPHTDRARRALLIMIAIVGVAAVGILPIAISAVLGVLAMILTRCLSWQDAAQALSTPVILIVVASLALGSALLKTGGADYLAQLFVSLAGDLSPAALLSSLMLLMAVLTNIVSNNAAAVIGTPIAIGIAQQLSLPAEPFVLAVLFGANMSYATPRAYKTNLLVMNAGGYTFADFVRVGVPLTLIVWATLSWLLPRMYGL